MAVLGVSTPTASLSCSKSCAKHTADSETIFAVCLTKTTLSRQHKSVVTLQYTTLHYMGRYLYPGSPRTADTLPQNTRSSPLSLAALHHMVAWKYPLSSMSARYVCCVRRGSSSSHDSCVDYFLHHQRPTLAGTLSGLRQDPLEQRSGDRHQYQQLEHS